MNSNINAAFANIGDGNRIPRSKKARAHTDHRALRSLRHSEKQYIEGELALREEEPLWAFANDEEEFQAAISPVAFGLVAPMIRDEEVL